MTISDVAQLRKRLYQPQQPFVLTTAEYKEQWKLGNNFWVRDARNRSSKRTTPNLWTSSYTCRMHMARAKYSSKPRKEKDSVPIDRRITSGYIPVECKIKLQVIEDLDLDQVTIQIHPKFGKEHTNHEMGDVDDRKRCIEAQLLIDNEAAKPYLSQTIAQHLPELVAKEHSPSHLADLGSSLITSKAVWNAKRKNPDFMTNPEPTVLTPDIPQAADNLEAEGFIVKRFLAASRSNGDATEGFAFARQAELEILQDCSHLVLLDSTHKTNRWDWRLFTCMVRDNFGSWIPAGQFFLERENGKSVAASLSALRTMILECIGKVWIPSNILIDQSHVERLGITQAFPGISAGEMAPRIYYCKVHIMRTFMRNLASHNKTYSKMIHALHKTTRMGCRDLVDEAIAGAPKHMAEYLENNWTNRDHFESWCMAARQHSPVLLQISSTNALESYHKQLKANGEKNATLSGAIKCILKVNGNYRNNAKEQARKFRTKELKHIKKYPMLAKLPNPLQRLVVEQIMAVDSRLEAGKPVPTVENNQCHCLFARQYMLPCVHLFHQAHLAADDEKVLTSEVLERFVADLEESGFEVYWGREAVLIEQIEVTPAQIQKNRRKTRVKAVLEQIQSFHFKLEDEVAENPSLDAMLENFIADLEGYSTQSSGRFWSWH